ncbi:hypothetical protein SLS62_009781 [Diatrype stigma]|uniref:Uncharacterized protein n=1 Tax=Diatrype stigma TaxID=117547 RepID=A0AAN9UDG1_9PEZI
MFLEESWHMCLITIPTFNSSTDCACRDVIQANILQAILEDEIEITNMDPTRPDNIEEAPLPDTNTAATSGTQETAQYNPPVNVQGNEDGTMHSDAMKAFEDSGSDEDYDRIKTDQSRNAVEPVDSAEPTKSNESTWENLG